LPATHRIALIVNKVIFGNQEKEATMNKILFVLGLIIVAIAALLLLLDVIESGVAAAIGILGIGLIATSGRKAVKR
jgi:small-conductance mechanosensitive channel